MRALKKGFTLIELLIVLSIIAALMSVATPVGINALAQAKATNVAGNFRTLYQAVVQMLMLEQNPPTSGDILDYLVKNNYISTKPNGFEITYKVENGKEFYRIRYINSDVDVLKVKSVNTMISLDESNKLIIDIPRK
ncbi:type II secretion system protein [Fervidobacterium nodosum]|uniref:type II secretion system protein n=1 Tax=Fervidobacterium nodosum TaxID=2424 RepID=UPI00393CE0B9